MAIFTRRPEAIEAAAAEIRSRTGGEILPLAADVNDPAQLERVVRATVDRFGRLDILVNNAGGPPPGTFRHADRGAVAAGREPHADERRAADAGWRCRTCGRRVGDGSST